MLITVEIETKHIFTVGEEINAELEIIIDWLFLLVL